MKNLYLVFILLLLLPGCGGGGSSSDGNMPIDKEDTLLSITVSPASISLVAGQSQQFAVDGFYSDGSFQTISSAVVWNSTDTNVVSIDSSGLAVAKEVGTIIVTATYSGLSNTASITVTAPAVNAKPISQAGADQSVITHNAVNLDGSSSSDPNGDSLTYSWSFVTTPAGSALTNGDISGSSSAKPSFTPDVDGTFILQLVVSDGMLASDPDTIAITALTLSGAAVLPVTGQTTSYYAGDDGEIRAGLSWPSPRFTDNGDGTVTDNLTGLMWAKNANCIQGKYPSYDTDNMWDIPLVDGAVTWQHALEFVAGIDNGTYPNCGAGYADWRLPNRREMRSLIDYSQYGPALPAAHPFVNVPVPDWYGYVETRYWTSTSVSDYPQSAIDVSLSKGESWSPAKWDERVVWPVRSTSVELVTQPLATGQTTCYDSDGLVIACAGTGQDGDLRTGVKWSSTRFTDNGDNTVTDNLTGLVWLKDANCIGSQYPSIESTGAVSWNQALDFVAGVNSGTYANCGAGHSDWRLPNINEIESLLNDGVADEEAWLGQTFINVPTEALYWSSTTDMDFDINAWFTGMSPSNPSRDQQTENKPFSRHVWPVRFPNTP